MRDEIARTERQTFAGWGRHPQTKGSAYQPSGTDELLTAHLPGNDLIARGLGRSYGDAAQRSEGTVIVTTGCDQLDWVERGTGIVRAAAGVSIGQMIDRFAPKGWFVPVTPGTRHVTVGGAIAADIHGKNHHVDGSFGEHVLSMRVRLANDEIVSLSPADDAELFWATVGGMGLTGIIVDAVIQLTPLATTTIAVETQRLKTLDQLMSEMRRSDAEHAFSVAWVDLLGRGRSVLTQGSFASPAQLAEFGRDDAAGKHRRPPTPSFSLPPIPLPRVAVTPAVKAFNELWWHKAPAEATVTGESITAFFHPLDAISDWNRVYGRSGFVQWQCAVPEEAGDSLVDLAERLGSLPSYFSVLKRFGPGNPSPLSFPSPGWTLAVDLPATKKVLESLVAFDRMVADVDGRLYLAKDARMERAIFEQTYPKLAEFKATRARVDPTGRFMSDLAVRLGL